ncbi:MAG: DeoR/GlpR family DNA-binding transcription regulator [Bacilli bacterium]
MVKSYIFSNIIATINSKGYASYHELSSILNCSESTVRRAVNELANQGKIIKERGGASSLIIGDFFTSDQNLLTRERIDAPIKKRLASKAKELIKDDMTIYIDAGSSTLYLARELFNTNITVVTNSFTIAKLLTERYINTVLIGGQIKLKTDAAIGPLAIDALQRFTFNYGFFGANGVTPEKGFSTPDLEEAHIKEVAIKNSLQSVFLINSSKFNKNSIVSFASLDNKIIITNYKDENNKYSAAKFIEA